MTLADLLDASYADLGYGASPGAAIVTRLTRYLNEGYRLILSMPEFGPLRSNTLAFSSVANQKFYGFPQALQTIDSIVDTTSAIRLRMLTVDMFRLLDPQEISSGTPTHYVPWGPSPVQTSPATTGVWAVSSAAGDTTQTTAVLGVRTGGLPSTLQTATLTGTARVAIGSFTDFVAIQQFEISAVAVGVVTLYDAVTAGNVLAQIPIGQKSVQYQMLRLWPTPSAVIVYNVDGVLNLTNLVQNYDIPIISEDFQQILIDYVELVKEYKYRDDSRQITAEEWTKMPLFKAFRDRIVDPPDYRPRVGRLPDRGSNLGPYFPSGRW